MIDQTKLPNSLEYITFTEYTQVAEAIRTLVVRGAPAIGVSGAFGLALAALQSNATEKNHLINDLETAKKILFDTRPTAVNLAWGLDKVMDVAKNADTVDEIRSSVVETVKQMAEDDVQINMLIGKNGSELFNDNDTIMTHCNAGALATVGYGTALGVIRATKDSGKSVKVIATETRPVQQGSRLTAFELKHDGIDVSLIPDTAVGYTMAKQHNIPFYVAAPLSTFDLQNRPEDIIIEQRKASEVTGIGDKRTAPDGINVINPAFDMTPPELISGIITENGIAKPPFEQSIKKLFEAKK